MRTNIKTFLGRLVISILSLSLINIASCSGNKALYMKAEKAIDGDTILLSNGELLRYIGIDTPEVNGPYTEEEPLGPEAREFNRKMVEGRIVRLEFDIERRDKYGRLLAYVWRDDTFINAALIKEGLAKTMTIPPDTRFSALFQELQRQAKAEHRGIWKFE